MTERTLVRPHMGAQVQEGGTRFAVWAPKAGRVEVIVEGGGRSASHPLVRADDGTHTGFVHGVSDGATYRYRLDGDAAYPDPFSRFQPEGPHGPTMVIDPRSFTWTDDGWPGLGREELVIYEVHVGTMTPAGTFDALRRELPELRRLGITAIELMPLADTPGRRNWGYDGVNLFAPNRNYGQPDDLRRLIDAAHRAGIGVLIDVVYNHLGPDGNYLRAFSDDYFTARHKTPWGDGINYDGANSRFVRDLVVDNARAWLDEYHADGLRLDAVDTIVDDSPVHILAELSELARAATPREVVLIAEQAANDVRLLVPVGQRGMGMDAVWADDFHHALRVLLTGEREGYFGDFHGKVDELRRAITGGFIFQGEVGPASRRRRGTRVTTEPASAFVICSENHDQVGNRAFGERLSHLVSPDLYAVASTLLLFAPETPLLFMGQEFAASSPFQFFTDHHDELGKLVTAGRRQEFKAFRAFAEAASRARIPDPQAEATFTSSKLDLNERQAHRGIYRLYRDLIRLRRHDPVLCDQSRERARVAELGERALGLHRWHNGEHRLLIANFSDAQLAIAGVAWPFAEFDLKGARLMAATSWRRYGGSGERPGRRGRGANRHFTVPAATAVILATGAASAQGKA